MWRQIFRLEISVLNIFPFAHCVPNISYLAIDATYGYGRYQKYRTGDHILFCGVSDAQRVGGVCHRWNWKTGDWDTPVNGE